MKIHIVQKDETLWKIAQKYGVNLDDVIAANPQISNPEMIMPGMKIKIPTTSGSKQQPAPSNKKQQVQPGVTDKKDKQEVTPQPQTPNQILPAIEEDEDKKWAPLKKEMPSLPIHFNKQPPQPAPSQASQDLKWTQLTNNFETHIHPTQMPDEDEVAGVEDHMKPEHKPMAPQHHHPQPLPMHAPCYSQDGIPYGYGHAGHPGQHGNMPQYPFPEGFQPQVMGEQSEPKQSGHAPQHHQGWYQAQMPSANEYQGQQMPWGPPQMPQNQMMPQQMPMQQQPNMPVPMPGEPMIPQPGAPNYPLMPMPYGMQGPQQMPNQPYGQQGAPYGQHNKNDCGCGGHRE
ncbi:SafA/ExsA family spore coat assembly protein [Gracilibacillus sp. D59]|uniref:SafA/ExsA family spore coat assembly protein n=1 Tax=Gracilibacillus sp. D59 TaxID=3457434 RepID=UPI003FCDDAA6